MTTWRLWLLRKTPYPFCNSKQKGHHMLGYYAIYGGQYSDLIRSQNKTRRWWQVWLPHQIDALN